MLDDRCILIVDCDHAFRRRVAAELTFGGGFAVRHAATLTEANEQIFSGGSYCSAIVLECDLPDGNGREYCRRLRNRRLMIPIMLVSAPSSSDDAVLSLEAGATDYLAKPCRMAELSARVRAQLRSFGNSDHNRFTVGDFTFHTTANLLIDPGSHRRIKLTSREAAILKALARADSHRLSRRKLIKEVWGNYTGGPDQALDVNISRLRSKIEGNPQFPSLLVTEVGAYRLRRTAGWCASAERSEQSRAS